jgi:hypothetical protein
MKVVVGEPVTAAQFRHEDDVPARAARRLTQWLLGYYGASESAPREGQPVKSATTPAPMVSALS